MKRRKSPELNLGLDVHGPHVPETRVEADTGRLRTNDYRRPVRWIPGAPEHESFHQLAREDQFGLYLLSSPFISIAPIVMIPTKVDSSSREEVRLMQWTAHSRNVRKIRSDGEDVISQEQYRRLSADIIANALVNHDVDHAIRIEVSNDGCVVKSASNVGIDEGGTPVLFDLEAGSLPFILKADRLTCDAFFSQLAIADRCLIDSDTLLGASEKVRAMLDVFSGKDGQSRFKEIIRRFGKVASDGPILGERQESYPVFLHNLAVVIEFLEEHARKVRTKTRHP